VASGSPDGETYCTQTCVEIRTMEIFGVPIDLFLQSLVSGILMGGIFALLGVGFSMTWGVMRIINIAYAAFGVLSAYMALWLQKTVGTDPLVSLVLILPSFFFLGVLLHRLLIRHLERAKGLESAYLVLTFGVAIILENIMLLLWRPDSRLITTSYSGTALFLGEIVISISLLASFMLAVIWILFIHFFLTRSHTGKAVRATWQESEGAALLGIDTRWVSMITFGLSLATAGAGGVSMALMYSFYPSVHHSWLIFLFLIAITGGVGSIVGAAVAGLLIGLVTGVTGALLPFEWVNVLMFGLLILILFVRPRGLFSQ
jgi:branched-chain amino acid transport system permease protein